jgi:hypothetical protein
MRGDICIHRLENGFRIDFRSGSETRTASGSAHEKGIFRSASQAAKFLTSVGTGKDLAKNQVAQARPDATISGVELSHDDVELCFPLIGDRSD